MSMFDIFRIKQIKSDLANCQCENEKMRQILAESERMTIFEIKQEIESLNQQMNQIRVDVETAVEQGETKKQKIQGEIKELEREIEERGKDLVIMDDEVLLQSFGFYKTKYALDNSEKYKVKLSQIREKQEQMVKTGRAAFGSQTWTVDGSKKEGARMTADYIKLILRSFNNECDACIVNVKFNNIESIEKRINKAFETLNKLGQRMKISIASDYLTLKLQELYLCYEYQVKKQEEKEEQKRIKEQMREEAKLLKEIEEMKLRVEKEEKHFFKAIQTITQQLENTIRDEERGLLEEKKAELEKKLGDLEKDKLNILYREQNTRAGYVYVISNIGSFGENIFKIGVTRRLEPADRVDELGDASVPFDFDIHAMIFSEDAPKLENALHCAFEHKRLNLINRRREYFNVTLDEVEAEIKKNFNKTVEFIRLPEAVEYRESIAMREKRFSLS